MLIMEAMQAMCGENFEVPPYPLPSKDLLMSPCLCLVGGIIILS